MGLCVPVPRILEVLNCNGLKQLRVMAEDSLTPLAR